MPTPAIASVMSRSGCEANLTNAIAFIRVVSLRVVVVDAVVAVVELVLSPMTPTATPRRLARSPSAGVVGSCGGLSLPVVAVVAEAASSLGCPLTT